MFVRLHWTRLENFISVFLIAVWKRMVIQSYPERYRFQMHCTTFDWAACSPTLPGIYQYTTRIVRVFSSPKFDTEMVAGCLLHLHASRLRAWSVINDKQFILKYLILMPWYTKLHRQTQNKHRWTRLLLGWVFDYSSIDKEYVFKNLTYLTMAVD